MSFCVPNPCDLIDDPPGCKAGWNLDKNRNVTYNALYSGFYSIIHQLPEILAGLPSIYQTDLTFLLLRIAFIQALPYLILFTLLIVILENKNIIDSVSALVLLILLYVVALLGVVWLYQDINNIISNILSITKEQIEDNIDDEIINNTVQSFLEPDKVACKD